MNVDAENRTATPEELNPQSPVAWFEQAWPLPSEQHLTEQYRANCHKTISHPSLEWDKN